MFLMPAVRLLVFKRYALLTSSIACNSEIINPCSCYAKKGLVYITITNLFSYQSSFYFKCTKSNTYILCNMRSVSLNKYIFFVYFVSF